MYWKVSLKGCLFTFRFYRPWQENDVTRWTNARDEIKSNMKKKNKTKQNKLLSWWEVRVHHSHIAHNASCLSPKILHQIVSYSSWAQLCEGRLALNPGLNLTCVSFSYVPKHFLGQFSLLLLELPIINL